MTSDRIEALEAHVAHQQAEIDDLSETVRRQWEEIEALKRETGKLTRTLEAMLEDDSEAPAAHQKPPHY
jgi:SlyX protein